MSNAVDDRQTSDPERTIPVRRVNFESAIDRLDPHFVRDDDVILSHLVAALSGVFPDGEELFIESVRHYRDQLTDPDLKRQVNSFIGQEVTHGREHRRLNEKLGELGYRAKMVESMMQTEQGAMTPGMERIVKLVSRVGPLKGIDKIAEQGDTDPLFKLALTAALEHYTAMMAEVLLTSEELQSRFVDEDMFRMWAWHAIEESEHKSVAFDVFKAVGGDEETRLRGMRVANLALVFICGYHTVAGVLSDRRSYRNFGLLRSLWRLRKNPLLSRRFRQRVADYNKPDFHPLQHDTTTLERVWRAWFDEDAPRPAADPGLIAA